MAGGAAVIFGAGGVIGAGLGLGGARLAGGLGAMSPARDVVRAMVYARVVLWEDQHDDEAVQDVVVAMEERLREAQARVVELAEERAALDEEVRRLRENYVGRHRRDERSEELLARALDAARESDAQFRFFSVLITALQAALRRLRRLLGRQSGFEQQ